METSTLFSQIALSVRIPTAAALCCVATLIVSLLGPTPVRAASPSTPAVGDLAADFIVHTLDGKPVEFSPRTRDRTTVLVVLRGWPGYQCPFCTTQVYEYVEHAPEFEAHNVGVIMVYPGPSEQLAAHAREFLQDKNWPASFTFTVDPDYAFTDQYGLRWSARGETAYPSTFIIDTDGKIQFSHVSREHGDRVGAAAVLRFLAAKNLRGQAGPSR
jgi:peroxiredoxin